MASSEASYFNLSGPQSIDGEMGLLAYYAAGERIIQVYSSPSWLGIYVFSYQFLVLALY